MNILLIISQKVKTFFPEKLYEGRNDQGEAVLLLNVDLAFGCLWLIHQEAITILFLASNFFVKTFVQYHNCIMSHLEKVIALLSSSFSTCMSCILNSVTSQRVGKP